MKQKYFYILFILIFSFSATSVAQNSVEKAEKEIPGLKIYPNPASGNKIYFSSTEKEAMKVEIFNVLGKKIYSASNLSGEVDISFLHSGVYLFRLEENGKSATRKIVVK